MKVILTVKMFTLPNYMKIESAEAESPYMDVGALFPTDTEAAVFWDVCKDKWLQHVASRRKALKGADNGT